MAEWVTKRFVGRHRHGRHLSTHPCQDGRLRCINNVRRQWSEAVSKISKQIRHHYANLSSNFQWTKNEIKTFMN
jgi:hypothetical protein